MTDDHDRARPEKPKWYACGAALYKKTLAKWEQARERTSDWAEERLQTFSNRLERIKPYLSYEFSLSKTTGQINNKNPEMAKLYEEHKAAKEKERQHREQEIQKQLEHRQKEKAFNAGAQAARNQQMKSGANQKSDKGRQQQRE